MQFLNLPIDRVRIGKRLRQLDRKHVKEVQLSFRLTFQIVPILIDSEYRLVDGWHRLEAAKGLGWENISAVMLERHTSKRAKDLAEAEANRVRMIRPPVELEAALDIYSAHLASKRPPVTRPPALHNKHRTCAGCHTRFTPKVANQQYCTPDCRKQDMQKKRALERAKQTALVAGRVCEVCGVPLEHRTLRARYCSASCRKRGWNASAKERE